MFVKSVKGERAVVVSIEILIVREIELEEREKNNYLFLVWR